MTDGGRISRIESSHEYNCRHNKKKVSTHIIFDVKLCSPIDKYSHQVNYTHGSRFMQSATAHISHSSPWKLLKGFYGLLKQADKVRKSTFRMDTEQKQTRLTNIFAVNNVGSAWRASMIRSIELPVPSVNEFKSSPKSFSFVEYKRIKRIEENGGTSKDLWREE